MESVVLCKDCKHSFRTWYDILFSSSKRYSLRCRLVWKSAEEEVDYVTGPKVKDEHYETCGVTRLKSGACGNEGKLWQPKDPKKFFTYMKRI